MNQSIRVLHLEDDAADAELVEAILEPAGMVCQITRVQTGEEFHVRSKGSCCLLDNQADLQRLVLLLGLANESRIINDQHFDFLVHVRSLPRAARADIQYPMSGIENLPAARFDNRSSLTPD